MSLSDKHRQELQNAMKILENPGIAARITNIIGMPIEKGLSLLPEKWNDKVGEVTKSALIRSAEVAVFTLGKNKTSSPSNLGHKIGVAASGAIGGFIGLPSLVIELPLTTTIMLRSIADIARSEGHDINDAATKLDCIEVFALGGNSKLDNSTESGYFAVRIALARSIAEAAEFLATKSITEEAAPVLVKLIVKIAERFSIQVTEKAAAQALPAIGAAGGAIVNTIFMDHFQDMAKGHFVVRRLEKIYGKELIQQEYNKLLKGISDEDITAKTPQGN
jgi:hypothetical protein